MKSILITSWLLLSSLGLHAQAQAPTETTLPVDTETKRVTYTGVVPVAGVTKSELYTRAKLWLAFTYDEAKDVIKVDEKDAGLLVIRAYSDVPVRLSQTDLQPTSRELGYTMVLNFKDGRYKYTLTNYQLMTLGASNTLEQEIVAQLAKPKSKGIYTAKQYAESIEAFAKALAGSLDLTLQKPVSGDDEW